MKEGQIFILIYCMSDFTINRSNCVLSKFSETQSNNIAVDETLRTLIL